MFLRSKGGRAHPEEITDDWRARGANGGRRGRLGESECEEKRPSKPTFVTWMGGFIE